MRDEPYYLACARHLAAGYVDQPPLSIWLLRAWTTLAGESLSAVRVVPALLAGVTVWRAARLARKADAVMRVYRALPGALRTAFTSVEEAARVPCADCMPYEQDLPVLVARGPRQPLATLWPSLEHHD